MVSVAQAILKSSLGQVGPEPGFGWLRPPKVLCCLPRSFYTGILGHLEQCDRGGGRNVDSTVGAPSYTVCHFSGKPVSQAGTIDKFAIMAKDFMSSSLPPIGDVRAQGQILDSSPAVHPVHPRTRIHYRQGLESRSGLHSPKIAVPGRAHRDCEQNFAQ